MPHATPSTGRRRWARRTVGAVVALPVMAAAVLGVEVELARRGRDLDDRVLVLDGRVGGSDLTGPPLHVTWLGDSTAAGVGATGPAHALPRLVATDLVRALGRPVDLTVLAVSGDRVLDVIDDQLPHVPSTTDLVVVDVGSNDVVHLTSRATFRSRYRHLLDVLPTASGGAPAVVLGVPDMGAPTRFAQPLRFIAGVRGGTLDAVVHDLARSHRYPYVDIAGGTGPAIRRDPGRYLAADHYHPSDAGYRLWANEVTPAVEEVLHG